MSRERGETQASPPQNSLQPIVAPSSAIPGDAEENEREGIKHGWDYPFGVRPAGVPIEKWNDNLSGEKSNEATLRSTSGGSQKDDVAGRQLGTPQEASPAQNIPDGAEASLTEWLDEVERNQRENERDAEEREWARQELLQEETDA